MSRITSPDGSIIAGVQVTAVQGEERLTAMTDNSGAFSLSLTPDTHYVLQLQRNDFADQVRVIRSPAEGGQISLDISMLRRLPVGSFSANAGIIQTLHAACRCQPEQP